MTTDVVSRDPEIMSGEAGFAGTRVLISTLFDSIEAFDSIEEFLEGFPAVSRSQVIALLEHAKGKVLEGAA
jgi:uncharacterized protein (DUF433 family)